MHPARRRHQQRAVDPIRVAEREFADHRAAHGVADQGRPLDLTIIEEPSCRIRDAGDVELVPGVAASAESREIGNVGLEFVLKQFGGGQQVPTGEAEPGHVHHDRGIGRNDRLPVEHVDAVERGPVLG